MNKIFKNLKLRKDTLDEYICKEIIRSYGHIDYSNKIVMDIGGCFGAFTYYALYQGAKHVYSYEPILENYQLLSENTRNYSNVDCYQLALSFENKDSINFYPGNGANKGIGSSVKRRGRKKIKVPSANFKKELHRIKPDVIKMDIEGGEYDLITKDLPKFVKEFVMEVHLNRKAWRNVEAPRLFSHFKEWELTKQPKITNANWQTIASWKR
tara:strand:- start:1300 stop:1932 length:633 start_codon:yes stop_codon:yes gene_type:complete